MAEDLETLISDCRWYWRENSVGTRERGLEDSVVYLFREKKFDDHAIFKVPTFLYYFNRD